jgi:enoyl-CoA hydratase/carnithine racemase
MDYQKENGVLVIDAVFPAGWPVPAQAAINFSDLCTDIAWDEEVRVVVLAYTAEGRQRLEVEPDEYGGIEPPSLVEAVARLSQPVMAVIKGDALDLGLEIALACDLRYASATSRFGFSHITVDSMPRAGGTQRLPRIVGKAKALEMLLTGGLIDAFEALRIGLVMSVEPSNVLMPTVLDLARKMASKAPIAMNYVKESVLKGMDLTLEQGLRLEADLYFLLQSTEDRSEGIKAFLEKRSALFKGQ